MAPFGWQLLYNSTTQTQGVLIHGFVPSPEGRGTIEVLESCLVTIVLCSWSVLFLNVPAEKDSRFTRFRAQAWWMLFTILFPEMLTGIAAEQWRSASQSVEDFAELEKQWENTSPATSPPKEFLAAKHNLARFQVSPWTMRHAFFADMGGILLSFPDHSVFPVDGHQLVYLVKNGHLDYPEIRSKTIWDKNKANICARVLTLMQILWFVVESIGRWRNISSYRRSSSRPLLSYSARPILSSSSDTSPGTWRQRWSCSAKHRLHRYRTRLVIGLASRTARHL